MIKKIFVSLLLATFFIGCQQEIDDYFYKETEEHVNSDVITLLKQDESYSLFVEMLERLEADTILNSGGVYTLFVPNNEAMEELNSVEQDEMELLTYLMTESYVNINQIQSNTLLQSYGGKFVDFQVLGDSVFKYDNANVFGGSPLTNNGRYYELSELVIPRLNLYEYVTANNAFFEEYLFSQDTTFLDKELSTPIGYTDDGLTIYDTVWTTYNKFEEEYFPISEEFRNQKATMLVFTQEQYDDALKEVETILNIPSGSISEEWQNEILMPFILDRSVFRNSLDYSAFSKGRAQNILGDSINVYPENIDPDYYDCSNGRVYDIYSLSVPEELYKVSDTISLTQRLERVSETKYVWGDEFVIEGTKFPPIYNSSNLSKVGGSFLEVDMGNNYDGEFSMSYKHYDVFPGKYRLRVRAKVVGKTGVYSLYVNDKKYKVSFFYNPTDEFDFFDMKAFGVISPIDNTYYPFSKATGGDGSTCEFDILVDNITEFGDVTVKFEYVRPSPFNRQSGLDIDFVTLEYYSGL